MQKNEDKVEKNEKKEQRISKGSIDSQISFVYHYNTRILHNGSALAFQARGAGSIPAIRSLLVRSMNDILVKSMVVHVEKE